MATDSVARALALSASGGGGGEPSAYLKDASVSDNTLTLTKKDNTTVTFEDTTYTAGTNVRIVGNEISATDTTYSAGANIAINDGVISATDTTYTAGENITITNNVISATGGGSAAGAVRYDQAQSLTEANVNQVWSNINLGCSKTTVSTDIKTETSDFVWNTSVYLQLSKSITNPSVSVDTSKYYTITVTLGGQTYTKTAKPGSGSFGTFYNFEGLNWTLYSGCVISEVRLGNGNFGIHFSTVPASDPGLTLLAVTLVETTYTTIDSNLIPPPVGVPVESGTGANSLVQKNATAAYANTASASSAVALGQQNTVQGQTSFAAGSSNTIKTYASAAIGMSNIIQGAMGGDYNIEGAAAFGYNNKVTPDCSNTGSFLAAGLNLDIKGQYSPYSGTDQAFAGIALGAYNNPIVGYEYWNDLKTYNTDDVVLYQVNDSEWRVYKSATDNNRGNYPMSGSAWWTAQSMYSQDLNGYLLTVGNGTHSSRRSNALAIDKDGNTEIAGTVTAANIPAAPREDGTYVLTCSIRDGVATYSWESQA